MNDDMKPLIEARALGMTYSSGEGAVHALRGADLTVSPGEYLALVGPSGSGKSTLMHILGCLSTPTAGTYQFDGEDVSSFDPKRLAEVRNRKVGFVFQRFHLLQRSSALENVMLPLDFGGVPLAERRRRASELLERVGLEHRQSHRPSQMSGGEQQRVAVARALSVGPSLLLADEPTGNLDSQSGTEIVALLEELAAEGRTLIVVTHDEELAARAGRVIRLLDGRIAEDSGAPASPRLG